MSQSVQPTPLESRTRRSSLRRWTLRVAVVLGILIILILIAAQIIFSTNLPRNLVVNALQKQLGLRITVHSLSTGWLGHTTLHDVAITLPLSDKAFLNVPELEIKHSPLPWLLLTGSLSVHQITIGNPQLYVVQDPSGSWNFQEVAQLLARAGGADNTPENSTAQTPSIPQLPQLDVHGATLVITDNEHRTATISNLSVTGRSDGPVVWNYHAVVPDQLDITGKVAPGGSWNHQITLDMHDIGSWMSPWINSWPSSAHLSAAWTGGIDGGGVSGHLNLNEAVFGSSKISGPVDVNIQSDHTTIQPDGLLILNSTSPSLSSPHRHGAGTSQRGGY